MSRAECTCDRLWFERHQEGCPRRNDHSKADEIKAALHRRHPIDQGEWVCWPEVFRIDVFAMRFWSSGMGLRRIAYEVKTSRADFLAEIRNPEKRAHAMEVAHQFVFATPKGLVRKDEIPSDCGLVEVDEAGRCRVRVQAPMREPRSFTDAEVFQLLRMPLFRSHADRMARRLKNAEERAADLSRRVSEMRSEVDDADRVLDMYAGYLVKPKTGWVRRGDAERTVYEVTEIRVYSDGSKSVVYAERGHEPVYPHRHSCGVGEFLRTFGCVDVAGPYRKEAA